MAIEATRDLIDTMPLDSRVQCIQTWSARYIVERVVVVDAVSTLTLLTPIIHICRISHRRRRAPGSR
jgi:hypothetical protein